MTPRRPLATVVADALALPASFFLGVYLTRVLGPRDFGVLTMGAGMAMWLELTLLALLEAATVKAVAGEDDWRRVGATVLRIALVSGVPAGLLLAVAAGPIAAYAEEPSLGPCLRIFALDIPLVVLGGTFGAILVGRARLEARAVAIAIRWVTRVVVVAALVTWGFGLEGAAMGMVAGALLEMVVVGALCGTSPAAAGAGPRSRLLEAALPWGLVVTLTGLVELMGVWAPSLLGRPAAEVGCYGAARGVVKVPWVLLTLMPVLLTSLVRLRREGKTDEERSLATFGLGWSLVTLPLAAVIAGSAREIMDLLFGGTYAEASPILATLIFAAPGTLIGFTAFTVLQAADREWLAVYVCSSLPLAALAGHLVLVPRYGTVGASVVTAACLLLGAWAGMVAACRVQGIPWPGRELWGALALTATAWALAACWPAAGGMVVAKVLLLCTATVVASRKLLRASPPTRS